MPTTINASNTTGGAVVTGDGSGILELQSGGVTGITVNGANVTVAGTLTATGGLTALTSPVAVIGNSTAGAEIRLPEDTDNGSNYVAIKAPDSLAGNLTFTLPTADGTNGQLIQTNGSGQLSFTNPTSLASPLAVVGNSTAGAEIRLPEDTDNGANYVALKAADSLASNLTFTLPSADGTNGQVLQTNGSGALSFGTIETGVTAVGSIARVTHDKNLFMFTPASTIANGGAKLASNYFFATATIPTWSISRYSTFYGVWYTSLNSILMFSSDGINYTPVDSALNGTMTSLSLSAGDNSATQYVIDDSNGYIFAFGSTNAGYQGYMAKSGITGSWGAAVNLTSASQIWYAEYVSFTNTASSGIVLGWSDSGSHYVATIAAGGTANTTRASTGNNNGQGMTFDWNKTAGVAMSVQRTPSSGQAALFLSPSNNINASWTSVTNTTTGFSPGSSLSRARPVISNAGYGFIWEANSNTYRYTTTTALNGAWTNATTPDSNEILYMGHNGSVWYMATGPTGTATTGGRVANFYTTSNATPTGWVSTAAIPFIPLSSTSIPPNVVPNPYYMQRKY